MSTFDPKQVEEAIAKHKTKLLDALESAVTSKLADISPSTALTLRQIYSSGGTKQEFPPGASIQYVKALLAFMKGKSFDGWDVDSAVTPIVMEVVEKEVIAFYSSQEITEAVIAGIVEQIKATPDIASVVRGEMQENVDWLRKEYTAITVDSSFSLSGVIIDASAEQIQSFLASSTGKVILGGIAQVMATTSGKIALQRMLMVIVQKVMASAALKATILATVKKVGVGILIKTAIGKAMVALLAAVGIAHVPVAWVLLPIIAGFLAYEYTHFPAKLSKKVPREIRYAIDSRFGEMNASIASTILRSILGTLEQELTKVRVPSTG